MAKIEGGLWTEERFRWATLAVAFAILLLGLYARFHYELPMPAAPPRPAPVDPGQLRSLDYTENVYRANVEKDARDVGITPPPPDELAQFFPYDVAAPRQALTAGSPPFETRDLAVSLRVARVAAHFSNGAMTSDHLVLRIENKTDLYVAYHVDTHPAVDPGTCMDKGDLPQNALALAPRAVVERTECATRNGAVLSVTVDRVETMIIPPLSYYYVSRLFPAHIGLDARATRGHVPPKGVICADIPEQQIRRGMEKGDVGWRDVVDFYARESCEKYIFPYGYRAFTKSAEQALPVPAKAPARQP